MRSLQPISARWHWPIGIFLRTYNENAAVHSILAGRGTGPVPETAPQISALPVPTGFSVLRISDGVVLVVALTAVVSSLFNFLRSSLFR